MMNPGEVDTSLRDRVVRWRMADGSALNLNVSSLADFPLYKATRREHLDRFMIDGTIRVGTLWHFRRTDLYGNSVGDRAEGVASCRIKVGAVEAWIANAERDQFIFCTSKDLNWTRFEKEGYDAAYSINSSAFFLMIAERIADFYK